jgi:hypothetical protein
VAVELESLRAQIASAGADVFLLSVRDGARPHAVSANVTWDGDELVVPAGTRSASNVAAAPSVTLLWPSSGQEYALIVDGSARVEGDQLRITPTHAVLHRSVLAEAASGHTEGDDPRCKPVLG